MTTKYREISRIANDMALPLFAFLTQLALMIHLKQGDILNSYPYVPNDGFDWVTQGLALKQLIFGVDATPWPILRPPGFVMITFLDSIIGASGIFIFICLSAGVGVTVWAIGQSARRLGYNGLSATAAMLAMFLNNFGSFRLYILSDAICIALMSCSTLVFLNSQSNENGSRKLFYLCEIDAD